MNMEATAVPEQFQWSVGSRERSRSGDEDFL